MHSAGKRTRPLPRFVGSAARPLARGSCRSSTARSRLAAWLISEIQDFRQLIDSIDAEYSDLAKNKRVEDALTELNRGSSAKLKLGPSQEYKNARKQLVQLEKQVQSNPMSSQSRKKAQTPKPKRSAIREH